MKYLKNDTSGFALLLTLVVVSVVLAIGLTLVDITLKQLTLSGTGRESEVAFHAAHAGAECAQFARLSSGLSVDDFMGPNAPSLGYCVGGTTESKTYSLLSTNVHRNQYQYDWGDTDEKRCTEIDFYIFDAVADEGADVSYDILEFDPGVNEVCLDNRRCTFILSRGYNRACSDITGTQRVIQREVLLTL